MKIFILNPFLFQGRLEQLSRKRQPLDLAYISSLLRNKHQIQLLDANALNYDINQTLSEIKKFKPEILILTSTPIDRWEVPSHAHIKLLIDTLVKVINKLNIKHIILTGAHGSLTPDWILHNSKVDFVVRGEPELTVFNLVSAIENNEDLKNIKGISFFHDGKIFHTEDAPRIKNLDELPFPAYDLLPMEKYKYTGPDLPPPFSIIISSRGCPFQCVYCLKVMSKGPWVSRSPESVVAEMKYLVDNFGIKSIYFQDWEFMIDKNRAEKISDLIIKSNLKIIWGCNGRAPDITDNLVKKMSQAGCVRINIGFESGSQKILDLAKKNIKIEDMERAINICRNNNIKVGLYSILNLPGENRKTIKESLDFLAKNNIETICSPNLPIPYFDTPLFEMLKKEEGKSDFSWEEVENYTGRIMVKQSPLLAKIYHFHYKYRIKYGKFYFLKLSFYKKFFKLVRSKIKI